MDEILLPQESGRIGLEPTEETSPQVQVSERLDAVETEGLLAKLKKLARRRKYARGAMLVSGWICAANLALVAIINGAFSLLAGRWINIRFDPWRPFLIEGSIGHGGEQFTVGGAWIVISALIAGGYLIAARAARVQGRATRDLLPVDDARMIGPLAQALNLGDPELRSLAEERLISYLPEVGPGYSELLDSDQRASLRRASQGRNAPLIISILRAWKHVGTKEDLPVAERLARGGGLLRVHSSLRRPVIGLIIRRDRSLSTDDPIRLAAAEAASAIRSRMELARGRDMLLRPAAASSGQDDTLLRPAHDTESTDPALLLRPSSNGS